ncbi:MAG: universal stress protein [Bacteroidia bacterium]|nr:universal stress protein [Bacteroidia bacterium]
MGTTKKPYPFQTILTAIAYSPRLEANLNEAARFCKLLGAKWILVHAGEKTSEKESKLQSILERIPTAITPEVIWVDGNPVEVMLECVEKYKVDLVIAGALQRENLLKFYVGSISREICRKCPCSVLLLTEPKAENNPLHKIVAVAPAKNEASMVIESAAYVAKNYLDCELTIVKEQRAHRLMQSLGNESGDDLHYKDQSLKIEKEMLEEDLKGCTNLEGISYKTEIVEGKPGYAINKFARKNKADMLCINGKEGHGGILDRIFTNDLEYILEDIPCTLLLVKTNNA